MHKRYSILVALIITILLITACGSKEEKNAPAGMDTREYILSSFPIPDGLKADSNLTWTATDDKNASGELAFSLVAPDVATLNANMPVQDFLDRALAINKDAKVTIEKLDIQVKDPNLNPLLTVNYVFNGQGFDGSGWTAEGVTPLQEAAQDPNLTYPIQQYIPPVAPTAYP
jgi:hypothetical protein